MLENIITDKEIKFNDLEKKIFNFVCILGCLIIKIILEKQDKKILESIKRKLLEELKEITALFEEADGLWISLQGKDRKAQIYQEYDVSKIQLRVINGD